MAKSIITQDGNIVNYGNLVAIYVEDDLDDDENYLESFSQINEIYGKSAGTYNIFFYTEQIFI